MLDEAPMKFPSWTVKLAAAAVIPVILGMGVAMSAPSKQSPAKVDTAGYQLGSEARAGDLGVDFAAVTGPVTSDVGKTRSCDDPSWPIVPFSCRDAAKSDTPLRD